jgi:protein-tyrosine phosphatase
VLRVLFVCTGNICRSPMAHGFLSDLSHRLLGGAIEVRSAGTWAHSGSPPSSEAVRSARARGVDIGSLRSTPFSPRLAGWADVVVAMTSEQRDEVLDQAPEAGERTFTLKELVALLEALPAPAAGRSRPELVQLVAAADALRVSGAAPPLADEDVADPLGLSMETFRAVAWEIEELVNGLLRGLTGLTEPAPAREG